MSESLQDRVVRIVSGSAHALLDKVEGLAPEAVMSQAIREIDQVIDEVRTEFGTIEAAKHQIATRLARLTDEHEELLAKAELAVREGRDDLAAASLERQILIEDQLPVLQRNLADQGERATRCEGNLRALLARKQEREALLAEFLASRREAAAATAPGAAAGAGQARRADRAEAAFDRVMARESGVSGLATPPGNAAKLAELNALQQQRRIEDRLAALKAQLKGDAHP